METSFIKKKLLFAGQNISLSAQLVNDLSDIFEIKLIDEVINVYKESRRGFVPDIILVDLEQSSKSGMSSLQLLKACKGDEILGQIPFIFLTSELTKNLITEVKALRADDLFTKSYPLENLRVRLKYLANKKKNISITEEANQSAELNQKTSFSKISINGIQRVIDILVTSVIILLLSPVLFIIGFFVKITSQGPVLTRSKFVGMDHSEFYLLRFRTAQIISDKTIKHNEQKFGYSKYHNHNIESKTLSEKEKSLMQSSPMKIKFTKLGLFLHKTGLENLPQLLNVVYGDLSLIGIKPVSETEISSLSELEWVKRIFKPVGFTLFNFRKISRNTKTTSEMG